MVHTYQRGHRQVFALHIVGGALPSSSTKQVHKGKGKVAETEMQQQEEHLHEIEQDFNLVNLDEEGEQTNTRMLIKEKKALMGELQVKLKRAKHIISYYKQENKQLESKHELIAVQLIKAKREPKKAKVQLEESYGEYGEPMEEDMPRRRPRTRGLKRALELEKVKEA